MEGLFFRYEYGAIVFVVVAVVVVVIVTVCRMLILICARVVVPPYSTTIMSMPVVWFVVISFCSRSVFRLLFVISFCSIVILRCAIFAVVAGGRISCCGRRMPSFSIVGMVDVVVVFGRRLVKFGTIDLQLRIAKTTSN